MWERDAFIINKKTVLGSEREINVGNDLRVQILKKVWRQNTSFQFHWIYSWRKNRVQKLHRDRCQVSWFSPTIAFMRSFNQNNKTGAWNWYRASRYSCIFFKTNEYKFEVRVCVCVCVCVSIFSFYTCLNIVHTYCGYRIEHVKILKNKRPTWCH